MGKSKQTKEKKFDRNVEISAPILDPEIIKAIHTPPKGQRLDIKHGGFKALLSDLNSQDSTDELTPLNDNHVPSYIGISCAVSGYSSYSSYSKKPDLGAASHHQQVTTKTNVSNVGSHPNRSQTTSPIMHHFEHEVHHITINKENIHSADEERKELTEKLTASATEHRRSPSPCIPPTEDDRHHGAYVGARYFPLPPPSKLVNKHIPLLGIDDEQNPDEFVEEENKVEHKIASLYGDKVVDDWRESMTHKAKKEIATDEQQATTSEQLKSPKDLVTLKPTPQPVVEETGPQVDIPTPNVKVLAQVEKQFLNKLLSDENPPQPSQSPISATVTKTTTTTTKIETTNGKIASPPQSPPKELEPEQPQHQEQQQQHEEIHFEQHPEEQYQQGEQYHQSPPMSPDSGKNQSFPDEELVIPPSHTGEEHIEYEIRAQSPLNNESSPVKIRHHQMEEEEEEQQQLQQAESAEQKLVSFSPEPPQVVGIEDETIEGQTTKIGELSLTSTPQPLELEAHEQESKVEGAQQSSGDSNDGRYYLNLLDQEKSFILKQVRLAEEILENQEAELDEDTVGRIRSAVGKANLLVNKKCNQFRDLCEANINKNSNEQYSTLNDDLAGFWDMLSIQVSDVRKLFETLWQARESGWNFDSNSNSGNSYHSEHSSNKSAGNAKSVKLSAQKDQERRNRLQQHMKQMKQNQAAKSSAENLLDDETEAEQQREFDESQFASELGQKSATDLTETATTGQEQLADLIGSELQSHQESQQVDVDNGIVGQPVVEQQSSQETSDLVDLMN